MGYSGEETFDWLCEEAQTLRVMPSDEDEQGLSTTLSVRCASGSEVAFQVCGAGLQIGSAPYLGAVYPIFRTPYVG